MNRPAEPSTTATAPSTCLKRACGLALVLVALVAGPSCSSSSPTTSTARQRSRPTVHPGRAACQGGLGDVQRTTGPAKTPSTDPTASGFDITQMTIERSPAMLTVKVKLAGPPPSLDQMTPGDLNMWSVYLDTNTSRPKHWKTLYSIHFSRSVNPSGEPKQEASATDEIGYATSNYAPKPIRQAHVELRSDTIVAHIPTRALERLPHRFKFNAHSVAISMSADSTWEDGCPGTLDVDDPRSVAQFPNTITPSSPTTTTTPTTTPAQAAPSSGESPQYCETVDTPAETDGSTGGDTGSPPDAKGLPAGLTLYFNRAIAIAAPTGWTCTGFIAQDGGISMSIYPRGQGDPNNGAEGSTTQGVVASIDGYAGIPSICGFFPEADAIASTPCGPPPPGERIIHKGTGLAFFEDPSGTKGTGIPSGGIYPANGIVSFTGVHEDPTVIRANCTLPEDRHADCTTILRDFLARQHLGATGSSPPAQSTLDDFKKLEATACTTEPQASQIPAPTNASQPAADGTITITDAAGNKLLYHPTDGTVTSTQGPDGYLPAAYTFGCDPDVFIGTWD